LVVSARAPMLRAEDIQATVKKACIAHEQGYR
jgi:hypothetical protein